jgi:hypothetical protein
MIHEGHQYTTAYHLWAAMYYNGDAKLVKTVKKSKKVHEIHNLLKEVKLGEQVGGMAKMQELVRSSC